MLTWTGTVSLSMNTLLETTETVATTCMLKSMNTYGGNYGLGNHTGGNFTGAKHTICKVYNSCSINLKVFFF